MALRQARRSVLGRTFNILYRLGRWLYDPLTAVFFGPEWHRWRQSILPWVEGGRTLEIGCGTGQLLGDLKSKSDFVVGIDLSDSMLQPARQRATHPQIDLVRASGSNLPFSDESFQSVISTFPASYIARESTLAEIARVLQPGGRFLVVVSARFTRFQWRRPFIHPILRLAYGSGSSMNRWPEDLLCYPELPGEWRDLPTDQGVAFAWIASKKSKNPDGS